MVKEKIPLLIKPNTGAVNKSAILVKQKTTLSTVLRFIFFVFVIFCLITLSFFLYFEKIYQNKIYPGIKIDGIDFGGKTQNEIEDYFNKKNKPYQFLNITLKFEDKTASISGSEMAISLDGKLSSAQAYSLGRSGHLLSDVYQKWRAKTTGINLSSVITIKSEIIDDLLNTLATNIDIQAEDALFRFENGKVIAFKLSKQGRKLNQLLTKQLINSAIISTVRQDEVNTNDLVINLPVETILPQIDTENSNNFGVKELLAKGGSKFIGSIPGRIHNIQLAASRINGRLIPPGEIFSFNNALGDVTAATGFHPAYIIKNGRTVLGDGGGVCQVSTTLFRAALKAGLPIIERYPHSYRVSYYEQDSAPGMDATVFSPNYDLKFKNDSQNYILIQAIPDLDKLTLDFELYGTKDDRIVEITKPIISSQTPPPEDLYQDDPTLNKGVIKQVDWRAWGAKVSFNYKVTKGNQITFQQTFNSKFQPWQAVFLRGTKE